MNSRHRLLLGIAIAVALVIGFHAGDIFVEQQQEDAPQVSHVMILDSPRKLAIPALQQANGRKFDTASLTGKWSLIFYGYTNCPDVCPSTLNTLALAKKEYKKRHIKDTGAEFPRVVFISVDPDRDSPALVDDYTRYFDKEFIGVTGEEKLLRAITAQTYANFIAEPSENKSEYSVTHSANLSLVNPDAELVAVLSPPHTVDSILQALRKVIQL